MNLFRIPVIVGALPVTLVNGTTADATQVMADLNWLVNQVNANAAPLVGTALTNVNNNFTVVQSGVAATQPANFPIASQVQNQVFNTLSSTLGTNTVTGRVAALALSGYAVGQIFRFVPSQNNTGAATISVDGLAGVQVLNMGSSLSGGEMRAGIPAEVYHDGNNLNLLNGTPFVQGPNIVSAGTLNLDAANGDYNKIDGTTTITAMTLSRGRMKWLEFTSSPMLTSSSTLIIGGSNVLPLAGDVSVFRGEASGVVRMMSLQRVSAAKPPLKMFLTSGTGATLIRPPGCTYVDVEMMGPGGGGGGTGAGGTGTATTLLGGTTNLSAGSGTGGASGSTGGTGGVATGGDVNIAGASGSGTPAIGGGRIDPGGSGGSSAWGGSGGGGQGAAGPSVGFAAAANSGSGGGGGGSSASGNSGSGGGSGALCKKRIYDPPVSFTYTVGAKGTGGTGGANVSAGGDGGDGGIEVDFHFD